MAQKTDTTFLKKLLESKPELFSGVLKHPSKNEVQVMYTQVNRDQNNKPSFKSSWYWIAVKGNENDADCLAYFVFVDDCFLSKYGIYLIF